jgi:hypothetical protein
MAGIYAPYGLSIELGLGYGPNDATPTFTDVTANICADIKYKRGGRSEPFGLFGTGSLAFTLDNSTGTYDPVSHATIQPRMPVQVSVTLSGTKIILFSGLTLNRGSWKLHYDGKRATVEVKAEDGFGFLATQRLPPMIEGSLSWDQNLLAFSQRIRSLLTARGDIDAPIPQLPGYTTVDLLALLTSAPYSLFAGPAAGGAWNVEGTSSVYTVGYLSNGENALDWLKRLTATEGGTVYFSRTGQPTFVTRTAPTEVNRMFTSSYRFSDTAATGIRYAVDAFDVDYFDDIINTVTVAHNAGDQTALAQTITNDTSIADFGPSEAASMTDLLSTSSADAYAVGNLLVNRFGAPMLHPRTLSVYPQKLNATRLSEVVNAELLDRCTVDWTPPGQSQHSHECFIESLEHVFGINGLWRCNIEFTSAERYGYTPGYWLLGTGRPGNAYGEAYPAP